MKRIALAWLAISVLFALACNLSGQVAPSVTAASTGATDTPGILPILVPSPSATGPAQSAPPSGVARPSVSSAGSHLAYLRDGGQGLEFVLMTADGKGQNSFPFPMGPKIMVPNDIPLSNLLSPDGKWLAFYTGSAGEATGHVGTDTANLTLNLMSLPAGGTHAVTRLLSTDYPANFAKEAKQLANPDITPQVLQESFIYGITQSIAWSPDGRYLAFAGEMDGPSSDLYLYDTVDGSIHRLGSGPEEVEWIDWSPDGKWIVNGSLYFVGEGMTYSVYATSVDGKVINRLLQNSSIGLYAFGPPLIWTSPHSFLTFSSANGPGIYGLEQVDVTTGGIAKLWDSSFDSLAADPSGAWVAVHATSGGLRLIRLSTLQATQVSLPDPSHEYGTYRDIFGMGPSPDRLFLVRDNTDSSLWFLSSAGTLSAAGTKADLVSVAPNHQDWIAVSDHIQLFTAGNSQGQTFNLPEGTGSGQFEDVVWRPDGSGVFLVKELSSSTGYSGELYAVDFASGSSALVEQAVSMNGPSGFVWVP